MKKIAFSLFVLLGRYCVAGTLYVSLLNGDVAVIDTDMEKVIHTIKANAPLSGLSLSPNQKSLFAVSPESFITASFNTETFGVNFVNSTLGPGIKVGYAPDNVTLYVPYYLDSPHSLAVFTNTVNNTIALSGQAVASLAHPTLAKAFVTLANQPLLSIINTNTELQEATITLPSTGTYIAFSPDAAQIAVSINGPSLVHIYNTTTYALEHTISLSSGAGDLVFGNNGYLYVNSTIDNSVSAVDLSTNTVAYTYPTVGIPFYLAYSPDTNKIYLSVFHNSAITVFDGVPNASTESGSINVGDQATGVAYSTMSTMSIFGNPHSY